MNWRQAFDIEEPEEPQQQQKDEHLSKRPYGIPLPLSLETFLNDAQGPAGLTYSDVHDAAFVPNDIDALKLLRDQFAGAVAKTGFNLRSEEMKAITLQIRRLVRQRRPAR